MAAARAGVRGIRVLLLAVATLHGCGEWTPKDYCEKKVEVECKNFEDILELKKKEPGAAPHDFRPSHLRFFEACQSDEEKEWMVKDCSATRNWADLKHLVQGKEAESEGTCDQTVARAMDAPQHVVRGRRVLDCMEASLEKHGKKAWEYTPEEGAEATPTKKAKPTASEADPLYCDCHMEGGAVDEACKNEGKVPSDVAPDAADEWCKTELTGISDGLSAYVCKCYMTENGELEEDRAKCPDPPRKGLSFAAAKEACAAWQGLEEFDLETEFDPNKCEAAERNAVNRKHSYRKRKDIIEKQVMSRNGKTARDEQQIVDDMPKKACEEAGGTWTSALELPPAPRRKRPVAVLAQDTSRVEDDQRGAKVRTFEPAAARALEVTADGQSRRTVP